MRGLRFTQVCIATGVVLISPTPLLAQTQDAQALRQEIAQLRQEFEAAGLGKLSPAELGELNEWMMKFLAYDSGQVIKSDEKIQELQNVPVRSRIVGSFKGWDGDTTFKLDNGEVWKQRLPGRYAVSLENPEVEISRNLLGFHELKIVQTGRRVGVTRLK